MAGSNNVSTMSDVKKWKKHLRLRISDATMDAKTVSGCRRPLDQTRHAVLEYARVHIEIMAEHGQIFGKPKESARGKVLEFEDKYARHVVQLSHLWVVHCEEHPSVGARTSKAIAIANLLWQTSCHVRIQQSTNGEVAFVERTSDVDAWKKAVFLSNHTVNDIFTFAGLRGWRR
jgi:hypothetical protein